MSCGNCKKSKFCPISLGVALGITWAICMFVWSVWAMKYGVSPMMEHMTTVPTTMGDVGMLTGWGFIKGFVLGIIFSLIYNGIIRCCHSKCCKKEDGTPGCNCGCGCKACGCCGGKSKTVV